VSLYLPTHRSGIEVEQDPIRLRNLMAASEHELALLGWSPRDIADLLAPARALVGDEDYWRHQSAGLAVFVAAGVFHTFRAPITFTGLAVVAAQFQNSSVHPSAFGHRSVLAVGLEPERVETPLVVFIASPEERGCFSVRYGSSRRISAARGVADLGEREVEISATRGSDEAGMAGEPRFESCSLALRIALFDTQL
jgi:hypothetical protein